MFEKIEFVEEYLGCDIFRVTSTGLVRYYFSHPNGLKKFDSKTLEAAKAAIALTVDESTDQL